MVRVCIYATCLRVLYAPARTTGRCVERIETHTDLRVQCLQSGRHYEWQNITRHRLIHVDAVELFLSKNNVQITEIVFCGFNRTIINN